MYVNFRIRLLSLGLLWLGLCSSAYAQHRNSISSREEKVSAEQIRLKKILELYNQYKNIDSKVAINYAREYETLAKQIHDTVNIVEAGRMVAYSLIDLGRNEEAVQVLLNILSIAEEKKHRYPALQSAIKSILNNLGIVYNYLGNYDKSLAAHYQSLQLREQAGDKKSISTALNNIGLVFYYMKDYKKALEYYERCIAIKQAVSDTKDLPRINVNLALCYNQLGNYDLAIKKFNEVLDSCQKNCDENVLREAHLGLGTSYIRTKKLDLAESSLRFSLALSKKQKKIGPQIDNLQALYLLELERGNVEKSLIFLNEAYALAKESNFSESLIEIYYYYAEIYDSKKNYEKKAYYLTKHIQLKDSVYNQKSIKNLTQIQTNYAERENIKSIKQKDQILVLQKQLLEKQEEHYIFMIFIALLILSLAGVMLWANVKQRQIMKELTAAKAELEKRVEQRTIELQRSNVLLAQSNEELDNFLYKTSHDIRGPLSTVKGLSNLAIISLNDSKVVLDLLEKLNTQIDKMHRILTRISAVSTIGKTELKPTLIDFNQLVDEITQFQFKNGQLRYTQIVRDIDASVQLITDYGLLRIILENLVDNSLKFFSGYSRKDAFVKITLRKEDDDAVILVEDNGIGITVGSKNGVFKMFMRGSEMSEIGGVGLYLCKVSTDRIGGKIILEKTSNNGTIFKITIPLGSHNPS